MKNNYEISKEAVLEQYEKEKKRYYRVINTRDREEIIRDKSIIEHLSTENRKTYFNRIWNYYFVLDEKGYVPLEVYDIKPKSIREKLHNIQEAREFYERTLRSR